MTAPGALPDRRSAYEMPAIDLSGEMTEAEQAQYQLAMVAAIALSSGEQKASLTNNVVLLLIPMLRAMDPYDEQSVQRFAERAAEIVELGRQQAARFEWTGVIARSNVYELPMRNDYTEVAPSRTTPLDVAYTRPAKAYRARMAAGTGSITRLIEQAEEERFQELGGDAAAKARTGESNAEVKAKSGSQSTNSGQASGQGPRGTGTSSQSGTAESRPVRTRPDPVPDADDDDWDSVDPEAEEARERALDEAFDAEQELREQARLSEEERQELLAQQAEQDMEIRAERMVNDDIAMAGRDAYRDAMNAAPPQVIGYRRVVHPELTKTGESCGLCIAASTRIYKKKELMPLHNLCKCERVEVYSFGDPGDQINEDDLGELYSDAVPDDEDGSSTDGRDLKRQRYTVFEHPELGPVLRNTKHKINRDIKFDPREKKSTGSSNAA